MCRAVVTKVLNMFKTNMRFFSPKYAARLLRDRLATDVQRSYECREHVATNFWEFTMRKFCDTRTIVVRMSYEHLYDSRATVLRIHANISRVYGEKLKLGDIRMNVERHAHECLATVVRLKMKLKLHSWELRKTHSQMSRDCYRATVTRYISKIRPKFANWSHKSSFNESAKWKLHLYR